MARAVADGGYDLHVWARRPASLEALTGTTYTGHDSVAELAAAVDVLLLCLRDDADIADLLEHRWLLDGLRAGSVVVNHGPAAHARAAVVTRTQTMPALEVPRAPSRTGAGLRLGPAGIAAVTALVIALFTAGHPAPHAAGPATSATVTVSTSATTPVVLTNATVNAVRAAIEPATRSAVLGDCSSWSWTTVSRQTPSWPGSICQVTRLTGSVARSGL
jgi:NAD binding domain of 6-phosphogluconate dehydrogenase